MRWKMPANTHEPDVYTRFEWDDIRADFTFSQEKNKQYSVDNITFSAPKFAINGGQFYFNVTTLFTSKTKHANLMNSCYVP
ncbi:hypothetical protein QDY71_05600 [Kingella negevensis]|uniref:Uncharacterized protein n=1 Tax=Kingella negevensis TaxID=1522312 RepID=A0A238HJJ1_9NEIS|nr:hypothetical protein [Kingella negevensis]MDK4685213.1 hypothetical protein [Kingella negevensis]MDK4697234.1 hypothetical protein [Kingella negevensis]MDK4708741.1 hypothetical protein [Kingella negevensis]MDK4709254.1 hypothetical protein [Kingella negevensis]WII93843.1 hypothetical protein QEO94_03305 [Kingella negevensis]